MTDFVAIKKNPWKINQALGGYGPICSLVSLYDLIFNSDDDSPAYDSFRISNSGSWVAGLSLDHDIICYNSGVYGTTGEVIKTSKANFLNYGLDIRPATFDPAAKAYTLKIDYPDQAGLPGTFSMKTHDRASALYPSSTLSFEGFPWDVVDADSTADLAYTPVSVGIGGAGLQLSTTFQLSETDPIFNATIKQDGLASYTKIALNTNNYKTWQIIGNFITPIKEQIDDLLYSDLRALLHNYKEALKYCYVWVKLRYFSDYINEEDFKQDLNPEASVQHKNMNISATGDFNRYERKMASTDDSKAAAHRPYIPKTVPSLDLLSDAVFPGYGYEDDTTVLATITDVIAKTAFTDGEQTKVGQLQTTPVNTVFTGALEGTENEPADHALDTLTHPGYFDPESRATPAEYGHKPVIVPKDGNIVADGRIMSPTIDEIWTYIKMLVDGRQSDDAEKDHDFGRPLSTAVMRKISEDLRPKAPKNFTLYDKLNVKRIGDPLDTIIINTDQSTQREKLVVKSYINAPEGLALSQYEQLIRVSEAIVGSTGLAARGVDKFLPWKENPAAYADVSDANVTQPDTVNATEIQTDSLWGPRPKPLSLREVEALLKQEKLNLVSLARFLKENFAVTGGLGRALNSADQALKAAGGLYQLHKDYNFRVDAPNTVFGMPAGQIALPLGEARDASGKILGKTKTIGNDYYGQSAEIPTGANVAGSSEVYLAADGTWRSLWEHVRMPIVSEEF